MLRNVVKSFVVIALFLNAAVASPFQTQPVYTSDWKPFVNGEDEEKGVVSRVVQLAFWEMGLEAERTSLDYYFSYKLVKNQQVLLSYPYFRTDQRSQEVLFSDPLMSVENGLFYNSKWQQYSGKSIDFSQQKVGKVAGYSYGAEIEPLLKSAKVFNTDLQALTALSKGEIDLLPASIEVAQVMLHKHFPHLLHEFKLLENHRGTDSVHLVASANDEGREFIQRFNAALARLKSKGMIEQLLTSNVDVQGSGYVRLVPAEGFPLITGYEVNAQGDKQFFVIPQGSRATVLAWHDVVLKPHATEKVFDGMMKYSQVKVVDGPHAGRSLFVRNMHLEVE
ncbi:substrate-binding periplasmic protein [Neptuniibacter sp. QD72_48]|uniref:substrate-binding periplasmic protein n=1 Tax=Neptuniibacter sp. QD72_48 TaxID=3398214 RepID=UPI0039F57C10